MKNNLSKNSYMYPDRQESITLNLIGETEPYEGYWSRSEDKVIEIMIRIINKYKLDGAMLDAGCGMGRLTKRFEPCFNEIYAVEPDSERYQISLENFANWNMNDKVKLFNCGAEELEQSRYFDVILCSHVIQHIPEAITEKILASFHKMLKDNGVIFFTTTHSITGNVEYYESYMQNSIRIESQINQDKFNALENKEGVLPMKFFTFDHIDELLGRHGFICSENRVYHNKRNSYLLDSIFGTDALINMNNYLKKSRGRDLFVCARKTTGGC